MGIKLCSGDAVVRIAFVLGAVLVGGVWAFGEMTQMPGARSGGGQEENDLPEDKAREARLREDVENLCLPGRERNFADPGNMERVATMIEDAFRGMGYKVRRQEVPAPPDIAPRLPAGHRFWNIEAQKVGSVAPREILVIGAHYDSTVGHGVGADDNASGVAGLLELGRILADEKTDRTVRLVAFANEEPPFFRTDYMGSRVYAREARANNDDIKAMMALEMIGYFSDEEGSQKYPYPLEKILTHFYPERGDFIAFVGDWSSRGLVRRAVGEFRREGRVPSEGVALPQWVTGVDWSDHASFWREGYPALMVTDTALYRNFNYHTEMDRPETLNYEKMGKVVEGVASVVRDLGKVE